MGKIAVKKRVFGSVILIDVHLFTVMQNSTMGPVIIGIFQAVLLLIIADISGIDKIAKLVDQIIGRFSRN